MVMTTGVVPLLCVLEQMTEAVSPLHVPEVTTEVVPLLHVLGLMTELV